MSEKAPRYGTEWRRNNATKVNDQARTAYKRDPTKRRASVKKARDKLRKQILDAYGNACACCGETTPEFLGVDHINGGGRKHRAELGTGTNFYSWLRKNNFPKDVFRLLCHNCNQARGVYGFCPHAKVSK